MKQQLIEKLADDYLAIINRAALASDYASFHEIMKEAYAVAARANQIGILPEFMEAVNA